MPHFTVVPVAGPRRGDYDNLEGLSWVDYGEHAERDESDGEDAPGWALAGQRSDRPRGLASMRSAGLARVHTSVWAQLFLPCADATRGSAPQTWFSSVFLARPHPHSSSSPAGCEPRAGAADVAARLGLAPRRVSGRPAGSTAEAPLQPFPLW